MLAERKKRIEKAIHHCMLQCIRYEANPKIIDPMSDVSRVELTNDCRFAKIFIIPSQSSTKKPEDELNLFKGEVKFFRKKIAEYINIKYAPNIDFFIDYNYIQGDKVLSLIDEISKSHKE